MANRTIVTEHGSSTLQNPNSETPIFTELTESSLLKMSRLIAESLNDFDKSTLQVRHSELTSKIKGNSDAIIDVNSKIFDLSVRLSEIEKENAFLKQELADKDKKDLILRTDFKKHTELAERRNMSAKHLTDFMLFQLSQREQRERNHTVLIHNFQAPPSEVGTVDDEMIFRVLIKPVLDDAKIKGELKFVPDEMLSIIEHSHPSPAKREASIPTYRFVFFSRRLMEVFLSSKNAHIDRLNKETALPVNPTYAQASKHVNHALRVGRDLSHLNRRTMWSLYRSPLVKACKVRRLGVCFKLFDGSDRWHQVENPFARNILSMTKPIPPVSSIITETHSFNPLIFEDVDVLPPSVDVLIPGGAQPSFVGVQPPPISGAQLPLSAQPPTVGAQPPTDGVLPPSDGAQPPTDGAQPSTAGVQPPTDGAQPSTAGVQLPVDGRPPAGGLPPAGVQPHDDSAQSPEIVSSAGDLARAIIAAQAESPSIPRRQDGKRPPPESPDLKPGPKKANNPQLSPMERRSQRAQHKNKNKKHR